MLSELVYQRGPMGQNGGWSLTNILLVALIILLVIALIYFVFFPRLENMVSSASIQPEVEEMKEENRNLEVAYRLMEPDETRVVKTIVEAGGSMLQKDISYKLEISRVKTHRILVKLINRGIVTAEKQYNTNNITLAGWLQE